MAIEDNNGAHEPYSSSHLTRINSAFSLMVESHSHTPPEKLTQHTLTLAQSQLDIMRDGVTLQFFRAGSRPQRLREEHAPEAVQPAVVALLTLIANPESCNSTSVLESTIFEHINALAYILQKELGKNVPNQKLIDLGMKALASAELFLISQNIRIQCCGSQVISEHKVVQVSKQQAQRVSDPSRRRFLYGTLGLLGSAALGAAGSKFGWLSGRTKESADVAATMSNTSYSEAHTASQEASEAELRRLVGEIKYYRSLLGLPELPENFDKNIDEELWQKAEMHISQEYQHRVDFKNEVYTRYLEKFTACCFGEHEHQICIGSYTDPTNPEQTAFSPSEHKLLIPASMQSIYPLSECAEYFLHEVAGHGTDPELEVNQFSPEVYVRVLHGKARMVTRVFNFPDLFLNHPDDTTISDMFKKFNEYMTMHFHDVIGKDRLNLFETEEDAIKFLSLFCQPDGKGGVEPKAVFERSNMVDFASQVAGGQIHLKGYFKELFSETFKSCIHEQYAELIKFAILYPDLINHDSDIMEGATQIFSAIKGEPVVLDQLAQQISQIPSQL